MNYKMVMQISGRIIGLEAALMILPLLVSFMYNESIKGFVVAICVAALVSAALILPTRDNDKQIASKEGFTSVSLSWIVISLIGAIPFTLEGEIPNYVDALFETISGLTTTGASILRNVEVMSRGLLFWRSFTHWIGGMGILVLMMAVAPMSDRYSMHLLRAEVPGPTAGKLVPKMRNSSVILYLIYFSLTILEMIVLLFCKMPLYDAAVTAFGTAGTGGFSVKQLSIGAYHSPAVEIAVAVFMMLFGVNFNMYFFLLMKNFKDVLKNEELRVYLGIVLFSTFTIAININGMFHSFSDALRHAFFQVTSISSTTGYSTADFDKWPMYSKIILFGLMFVGGCAGSTAGGLKLSRIMILIKSVKAELKHQLRPRSVNSITLDNEAVSKGTLRSALVHFFAYMFIVFIGSILLSFENFDIVTTVTSVITCLSNVGPGYALVGPYGGFADFSSISKLILSACMLFGRLEIFPVLVLFLPHTWKKASAF